MTRRSNQEYRKQARRLAAQWRDENTEPAKPYQSEYGKGARAPRCQLHAQAHAYYCDRQVCNGTGIKRGKGEPGDGQRRRSAEAAAARRMQDEKQAA